MKPLAIAGLMLIILGIAGLVVGHFAYSTDKKLLEMGPVTATVTERHTVDMPDIAGIGAILAGGLVIFLSRRSA